MLLGLLAASSLWAGTDEKPGPARTFLPDLVLCGKKHDSLFHIRKNKLDWEWPLDGPVLDVQPQPAYEHYLVTGGSAKVSLLRKVWKGCKVFWDWKDMEGVSIVSAVVADWDERDNPTLVLAADAATPRLFLAEAKGHDAKVRWEFKLPAVPLRVHLCTDTGNFLVVLADSTVQEVLFQEDKVVMALGHAEGLQRVLDAVRDPWANTYVADAASGDVLCFGPKRQVLWKTHLPFAPGKPEAAALSLYRKAGKRLLMASVHFSGGNSTTAQDVIYALNTETGGVLAWSDKTEKGGYPNFTKCVPDRAEYLKKQ